MDITKIILQTKQGPQLEFNVDPDGVWVTDIAGNRKNLLAPPLPPAPTAAEIAQNPGKFDGDASYDPTLMRLPPTWFDASKDGEQVNLGTYYGFADFFLQDQAAALRWFKQFHAGQDLNLGKLGPGQKSRLKL